MKYIILFGQMDPEMAKAVFDKITFTFGKMNIEPLENSFLGFIMEEMRSEHLKFLNELQIECLVCKASNTTLDAIKQLPDTNPDNLPWLTFNSND